MNVETWPKIEELFHAALALAPAERAAWLASACGDDDALRAEVESLLAADEQSSALAQPVPALAVAWAAQSHPLIGKTVGRYQLLSLLGAGGMGEVFLAQDIQHRRKVALKLLPAHFTADQNRVRRFEQEAYAVLALNHPNIVTLFDLGQADGAFFMATEFIEGETLRQRLRSQGALTVSEALDIAQQIAAALVAAHANGIIHRDIKPENVMVRRDGYVKVLDFGLAKVAEPSANETDSAEESSLTDTGAIMGTARYMSPEQARGLRVDARTDVFSLGVVLYEMLTGRAPFTGDTRSDVIVSILTATPASLADAPAALETIVQKALAKDADGRFQTVKEFAGTLKTVADHLAFSGRTIQSFVLETNTKQRGWRGLAHKWRWQVTALILTLAGYLGWQAIKQSQRHKPEAILSQLKFNLVDSWQDGAAFNPLIIDIAPDGQTIAYSRTEHGQGDIFIKQLPNGKLLNVTNDTWHDSSPLWSPDGRELAYLSLRNGQSEIWVIPSLGGQGRLIKALEGTPQFLESWSHDGQRLFYEVRHNFYSLEVKSGLETQLTHENKDHSDKSYYALSPDELALAYAESVNGVRQIFVKPLIGGVATQVTHEGEENQYALWLPDGERIVYSSKRNGVFQICVAGLDGSQLPQQLTSTHENMIPWDVSPDGHRIFYVSESQEAGIYLHKFETSYDREFLKDTYPNLFPTFSPEGKSLAYQRIEHGLNLFTSVLYAKETDKEGRITRLAADGFAPLWSPYGSRLAYLRLKENSFGLWTVRSDGAEEQELVSAQVSLGSFSQMPFSWSQPKRFSWSPDETTLAYVGRALNGLMNIWNIPAKGGSPQQLSDNQDIACQLLSPMFSFQGDRIAYLKQLDVGGERTSQVWMIADGCNRMLFQANGSMRLLGWSLNGNDFWVGITKEPLSSIPSDISIVRLSMSGKRPDTIAQLQHTYINRCELAPDSNQILYVSRANMLNSLDEVWSYSLITDQHRKVTQSPDPAVLIGGLAWSPQQKQFSFIKQSSVTSIWVIEGVN